jgi:membrane-bound lytic murein transglycosylase D
MLTMAEPLGYHSATMKPSFQSFVRRFPRITRLAAFSAALALTPVAAAQNAAPHSMPGQASSHAPAAGMEANTAGEAAVPDPSLASDAAAADASLASDTAAAAHSLASETAVPDSSQASDAAAPDLSQASDAAAPDSSQASAPVVPDPSQTSAPEEESVTGTLAAGSPADTPPETTVGIVTHAPIMDILEIKETFIIPAVDRTEQPDDLWDRVRLGFAMPELRSPLVRERQSWYAGRPQMLRTLFDRSKRYLYHIVEELEKRGMPTELALLPMVESAFNPMAYSSAHASGLWQFIPSTGKRYELEQNSWYDGRRDVLASTTAALDYLQFLYDMHGDWHLALASYNWGENAVARAIERNRARGLPTDYLSLSMPSETRYYVPKLQALKNIIAEPRRFAIDVDAIPNQPYFVTVPKTRDIDIRLAAQLADLPVEELIALNPAHNRPVFSTAQSPMLVLPADRAQLFLANLESHDKPLTSWRAYTLKRGDRLEKLAADSGIALAKLKQANGITPRSRVGPGFQLLLPIKGSAAAHDPLPTRFTPPAAPVLERTARTVVRRVVHTVQRGETLTSIAQRYKVSVDDLRRWNAVGRLLAGQKLQIEQATTVTSSSYRPAASKPATRKRAATSRNRR